MFERYFDRGYYLNQVKTPAPGDLYRHYSEAGQQQNLDPNPFFCTEWYKWQNPDWSAFQNPLLHFVEKARFEGRDPSPKVDIQRYAEQYGLEDRYEQCFERILQGHFAPGDGVYRSWSDLRDAQADFVRPIQITPLRPPSFQAPRRNLVFIQCGASGNVAQWLKEADRNFDILLNYYDARGPRFDFSEYAFFQPGTKFTGVSRILETYPALLRAYDYVLFLDDDILVENQTLNRAFESCANHGLDLGQMALSASSECIWNVFYQQGDQEIRLVNGVEIMMPILSRRAIRLVADDFAKSVSGFGLDFLFSSKIAHPDFANIAILNQVCAHHAKPIDDRGGAYYSYLRSVGINPKAELWYLISKYRLERSFYEVS